MLESVSSVVLVFNSFVLVFFSPFNIAITSLWEERELILVLLVRLFDLRLFGFVGFLFLLMSGKGAAVCDCATPWTFLLPFFFFFFFFFFFCKSLLRKKVSIKNKDFHF